jgi:hypothetical protein
MIWKLQNNIRLKFQIGLWLWKMQNVVINSVWESIRENMVSGYGGIHLAQDTVQWLALVNMIVKVFDFVNGRFG